MEKIGAGIAIDKGPVLIGKLKWEVITLFDK